MLKSLTWKLILAFLLIAFMTGGLVGFFIRLTNADRLSQFIVEQQRSNLEQALTQYYTANGSWDGIEAGWQQLQQRAAPTPPNGAPPDGKPDSPPPGNRHRETFFGLADASGLVIVAPDVSLPIGTLLNADALKKGVAIVSNDKTVGTILTGIQPPSFNPAEALFLERTNQAIVFASLGAVLAALIIGVVLARTLTRPLKALTLAAGNITRGQLEQQVNVRSNDEIGQLAEAFNQMSQEVARVNQSRRQMTADIAHDLRTPLTVISGYIEAMRDGDLKPTQERFDLIYSEIERLQNLVGDLRMLSLAETGELSLTPQRIQPIYLLERAAALFRHQAEQHNVTLTVQAVEDLPDIWVDEARMMQILGNLISNSLRYAPAVEGWIILSSRVEAGKVALQVQDNGSGIAQDELPHIFDRFYRADKSRHSETGEAGLGLAIVKALVSSQGGTVAAESTPGTGTTILLAFPVASAG
jgi:signal transduction histidine kinase